MLQQIDLGYRPRSQFIAFHKRQQRFAVIVAHRRAGKTVACIADLQARALRCQRERPRFAYVAPYLRQAKSVAWDYLKAGAGPLLALGATINETELRVDYHNGAQVRLFGADNAEALRGIYLDGVVCDEYGDWDPRVYPEIIRPALADREGGAVFIGTPKGRNQFYDAWKRSESDPQWFSLELKVDDTGLVPQQEIDLARRDLSEDQYAQEFECSFDAATVGSYYGKLINAAEVDKRIAGVPYDPAARVWTAWDLGIRDATSIWFAQVVGREVHIIDHYEASGVDLGHYVREINLRPYVYAGHIVPHDAQARELGTGKSRLETLEGLGLRNLEIAPDHRVEDGINAVRVFIPRCWFDARKCARGIDALKLYRAEYDDKLKALKPRPVHDWCFAGDTKVLTRYGIHPIKELPAKGEVLTPCGWKPYHSPRLTRKSAHLVEVRFVGGHSVRCTPDHLFLTVSGWKSAECLTKGILIQSSLTCSRSISMAASIACGRVRDIFRVVVRSFIEMLGQPLSGPCLTGATSTIKIPIQPTIRSSILNAFQQVSIYRSLGKEGEMSDLTMAISRKPREMPPLIGTSRMLEDFGTDVTPCAVKVGQNGSVKIGRAISAALSSTLLFAKAEIARGFVALNARSLRIESVARLDNYEDVYCITVPSSETFSLWNGAVVHNCSHAADAFRYLSMTLDRRVISTGFDRKIIYPNLGIA